MDLKNKILNTITTEDIVRIFGNLGVDYKLTNQNQIVFKTACHGGSSYKLYYYGNEDEEETSGRFYCYTHCGSMSIFTVLMNIKNISFRKSLDYFAEELGIASNYERKPDGFNIQQHETNDMDIIEQYKSNDILTNQKTSIELPDYPESILNAMDNIYPTSWLNEGISLETMNKFEISFQSWEWKAVIPHRDINGRLVGVRGRSFKKRAVENGNKYMPLFIDGQILSHPLHYNLYGVYQNKEAIKRNRKILLAEGEKTVMRIEEFYPNNNFSVALCGTNLSNYQRNVIIFELGVEEVFIAFDKEKKENMTKDEKVKYDRHLKKIKKTVSKLEDYCTVHVLDDNNNLLDYQDSPVDKGQEIFEQLLREKVTVS